MGSDSRRLPRGASLSRRASFLGCFNGVVQQSYEAVASGVEQEEAISGKRDGLQLGSKSPKRCFSFSCAGKVKEACGHALQAAKKGSPHICDLFSAGQLFMPVPPPKPRPRRLSPSVGFLHIATPASVDSILPHR